MSRHNWHPRLDTKSNYRYEVNDDGSYELYVRRGKLYGHPDERCYLDPLTILATGEQIDAAIFRYRTTKEYSFPQPQNFNHVVWQYKGRDRLNPDHVWAAHSMIASRNSLTWYAIQEYSVTTPWIAWQLFSPESTENEVREFYNKSCWPHGYSCDGNT